MKKLLWAGWCAFSLLNSTWAALPPGATAPDFTAQASKSGSTFEFSLQNTLKQGGPVVVYFYPSAYTGGCNIQAHTFAVEQDKFVAAGATIIGVSLDSIDRLKEFSADPNYCAGKFGVASDSDGSIAKAYELTIKEPAEGKQDSRGQAITHGFAERVTFVITQDQKIAATITGLKPAENVAKALEIVQQLATQKAQTPP